MSKKREGRTGIFPRFSVSEDVEREIRAHLEARAAELEADGWGASEAREEAQRLFGNQVHVARECRDITRSHHRAVRRGKMIEMAWQDIRYGLRTLAKNPVFTLVAVMTLALGIGANTAIFSVVNGVLLRPLPYEDPQELVWMQEINNRGGPMAVAWANFVDWREESTSLAAVTAYGSMSETVLGSDRPVRAQVASVTEDFWSVFPVRPIRGRLSGVADYAPGAPPMAVVSQAFWQNELGGGELEGRILELSGARVQVVGVIPADFDFPSGTEIWGTPSFLGQSDSRTAHNWDVVGRIDPGISVEQARQEIDALTKQIVLREPDASPDYLATGALVVPLHDEVVGESRTPLLLLFGAAGLVLLVACTNLASTLLARGSGRMREFAVRTSLGASRGRIVRQLLTESVLLAVLGASAGTGLALLVMRGIRLLNPSSLPRLAEIGIDGPALVFTGGVAFLTALLFGLFPARSLAGRGVGSALRDGSRGNAKDGGRGIWQLLVGTEVALTLILLVGSGLLVRSFQTLLNEDVGFDSDGAAAVSISLSQLKYPSEGDHAQWFRRFLTELEAHPGVASAGVLSSVPLQGFLPNGRVELDGDINKLADGGYVVASRGAFEALNIPLLRGRLFDDRDGPGDPHVALVSQSFAEKYWPGEDPIGKSVTGGGMDNLYSERPFSEVVGVVGNVRFQDLGREGTPTIYFAYTQRPFRIQYGTGVILSAAAGDAGALTNPVRTILQGLDPDVPLRFRTMDRVLGDSVSERRFILLILGGFSLTGLLLAGIGIYGVVSYTVARRTREMGIRLALGASAPSVLRMVMAAALRMVVAGLVVGVIGSLALTRLMGSLLYEVSPRDPLTLVSMVAALAIASLLAAWVPARAGTRVDPMIAMRSE